jgi:hypothetical protein
MKLFMDGDDLSPYGIMRKAIDNERYDRITYVQHYDLIDLNPEEESDSGNDLRKRFNEPVEYGGDMWTDLDPQKHKDDDSSSDDEI